MRARAYSIALLLILIATGVSCGGGGGGDNNIVSDECNMDANAAFNYEVYRVQYPALLNACPFTLSATQAFSATIQIDVRMSRHTGSLAGWFGNGEMWTKNLAQGNVKQFDQDFAFSENAPYTTLESPYEQPVRGQFTMVWTAGQTPASGQRELDSLDVWYPLYRTHSDGSTTAWMYVKAPVVVTNTAGTIIGEGTVLTGEQNSWRVQTHWDTTGYKFQWYVDGSASSGDTAATFFKTFNSSGTYTLRVDQIRTDSTALSSYLNVRAFYADIGGPDVVQPSVTCAWYANVSGGTAPYSYRWLVSYTELGSGQYFEYWNSGYGFLLQLIVTDAAGGEVTVNRNISVDSGAMPCAF